MRHWPKAFVLLGALGFAPVHAQTQSVGSEALHAIDGCVARLDATLDVGYERIAARCPHLAQSLERAAWAQWLPLGWKEAHNDLSSGSLLELRALVAREIQTRNARTHAPNVKRLNEILTGLGPAAKERTSLWSRFRAWLRTIVEKNKSPDERSWLDQMIQRNGRSQTFIDLATYGGLALIIVLATVIVVNELRAAASFKSRSIMPAGTAPLAPARRRRVSWRDIERATAAEKARLLLELVLAKLAELRRIPPAGALTTRELARSAQLLDAKDRERLQDIALVAERARYAGQDIAPEAVGAALQSGRELMQRLEGSSA